MPAGIGALINLRYLNLSNTSIEELATEIMYLKNLKILLLDGMWRLLLIPAGVIPSLLSLQVFSLFSTEIVELQCPPVNDTTILDELECLGKKIHEISITLGSASALSKINFSSTLSSRITGATIMHNLDLPSVNLANLKLLETLNTVECSLEMLNSAFRRMRWSNFHNLHHLSIRACPVIRVLTWIREALNLQFLSLVNCQALSEIIESAGSSEVEENYFSNLMVVDLDSLPSLKMICHGTKPFLSLQTVSVNNCPNLRKLAFNSDSAKNSLVSIRGSAEWWEQLRWEHEATNHVFAAKFHEL